MAPRASKRAAAQASADEPGAKRVADFLRQHNVSSASYRPVLEALQHPLSRLSGEPLQMVMAILPWSLAVPADERHAAQKAVVVMAEQTIEVVLGELQRVADVEAGKVDELQAARDQFEGAHQQAETADADARQALEEQSKLLSQAAAAVLERKAVVQNLDLEERSVGGELEQTTHHSRSSPEAWAGPASTSWQAEVQSEAMPEAGPQPAALAASAARAELAAATSHQAQVAERLCAMQSIVTETSAAEQAAKAALTEHEAKIASATAVQGAKAEELELFRNYNVCMFALLRDRVSDKQELSAVQGAETAALAGA